MRSHIWLVGSVLVTMIVWHTVALQGDHVCFNDETYTEVEHLKTTHPVKIRSYNWCLSMPPRCSNYRTEMREVIRLQNVTKTRLIEFCCDGYAESRRRTDDNSADNDTTAGGDDGTATASTCEPICRGGCEQGVCTAPNRCTCSVGYEGRHCSQRCRYKMFGQNCAVSCRCRNGALCDHRYGHCRCTSGWIGEICDRPCPPGYYGIMCKRLCSVHCASGRCDAQTGVCTPVNVAPQIIFSTPANRVVATDADGNRRHIMRVTVTEPAADAMRIKAKHWIAVAGNGRMQLRNCTALDKCPLLRSTSVAKNASITANTAAPTAPVDGAQLASLIDQTHRHHVKIQQNHTMMMSALNSSIANLTSDVGKLSQQIVEQQQQIDPQQVTLILGDAVLPVDGTADNAIDVVAAVQHHGVDGDGAEVVKEDGSVVDDGTSFAEDERDGVANDIVHLFAMQPLNQSADSQVAHMTSPPMVPVVLVVLVALILLSLVAFGLTYIVRRANGSEPVGQRVTRRAQHVQEIKLTDHMVQKPLPDIPSFTQSFSRRDAPQEFYDRPSNNHISIIAAPNASGAYSYTSTTASLAPPVAIYRQPQKPQPIGLATADETAVAKLYSIPTSRKPSCEHIYDEIKYADRQPAAEAASRR